MSSCDLWRTMASGDGCSLHARCQTSIWRRGRLAEQHSPQLGQGGGGVGGRDGTRGIASVPEGYSWDEDDIQLTPGLGGAGTLLRHVRKLQQQPPAPQPQPQLPQGGDISTEAGSGFGDVDLRSGVGAEVSSQTPRDWGQPDDTLAAGSLLCSIPLILRT